MHNTAGSNRQPDGRNENYLAVVTDLASLIERIQASIQMLEPVIARALPPGERKRTMMSSCWMTSRPIM
jgi:hypothetical protein